MQKFKYNQSNYQFYEKISDLFNCEDLSSLIDEKISSILSRQMDQKTIYHPLFYEWARTDDFKYLYSNFILNEVKPIYNQKIVYQTIPTFRIAFNGNIAVGEFHKDKNYRDLDWADSVREDNFFLPITDAFDTNTIWVESQEDKGDFSPMDCEYGSFIKWDGSNLKHGNMINKTGKTRVSFDFRVISYDNYKPSEYGSINTKTKFKIGEYYSII